MNTSGDVPPPSDSSIFPDEEGTERCSPARLGTPIQQDSSIFPDEEGTERRSARGGSSPSDLTAASSPMRRGLKGYEHERRRAAAQRQQHLPR